MNDAVVALAVLATVAPARSVAAAPDVGVARVAAAHVVAAIALVALAAAGSGVLDALDVSDPNAAIAAGLVVALTAVLDLVRRDPVPVVVPDGPVGVLVPLAWPLALRPAGAVLALAAGAAGAGVGVVVGAALAVGLAAAVAAGRAAGRGERGPEGGPVPRGVGALVAVVGASAAVDLLVDGVLAV